MPLKIALIVVFFLCALVVVFILAIGIYCAKCSYMEWRERRDMHIRNKNINRYNMGAFRGTKDRF